MSLPPDIAQATADLCAALSQERAYVEASDFAAVWNLRLHKRTVFDRWRALVEATPMSAELAADVCHVNAYVQGTMDLTAAALVAISPSRGSA